MPGDDDKQYTKAELDAAIAEANAALEVNRNQLLKEAKDAKKKLDAYSGIDPEKYRTLEEAAAEAERKRAEGAGDWKAREAQLVEKFGKESAAKDGTITTLRSALERRLVDAEATSALAAAKGSPKVLLPHIKSHVKVVEEDGEFVVHVVDQRGNPRIGDSKGAPMTIAQLVEELKQDPDFARNFEGTGSSGGGASKSNAGGGGAKKVAAGDNAAFLANLDAIADGTVQVE